MRGLSEHQLLVFLVQFAVLLGAARLLGAVARRLGQPSVMGEVIAGVLLGPTVLGHAWPALEAAVFPRDAQQGGLLELLSWIGMILLMLRTGIDTDLARWRTLKGPALLASLFGIAVPFAVGIAIGAAVPADLVGRGGRGLFTVFVGTAMSISAVKVIAKILLDLRLMRRDVGFVILGASILDDTIGWVILAIVVRVASTGRFGIGGVATTLGATAGFGLVAMLVVRPLAGRAIRWLEREGRLEHGTTTAVLVLTLACAATTQALGIHAIFGAFVAGLLVGESPRVKEATLESIDAMVMGVFAPVFFAYSGLKVEALALPGWPVTLLVLGGAVLGKIVGAGAGARLGGMRGREAHAVGIGLSARGSTELVVARIGMDLCVLAAPMYALIVLIPIVTSLLTPPLLRLALRGLPLGGDESRRLAREASEERAIIPRRGTKILVPTSGEPHALQALRLAAPLARLPGATLVGLSVLERPRFGRRRRALGSGRRTEEEVVASSEAVAREFALPDFHATVVKAASVDDALRAEVARGYDVVFLGVDRPRALSHRLLRGLLASGGSDVVVVRRGPAEGRFARILVPVTGSTPSLAAVELGLLYARETGAALQLLHVVDPDGAPDRGTLAELHAVGQRMVDELVERARRDGVDARARLATSRYPARAILEAAADGADLVLVGSTPRYVGRRAFFGPTTDLLLSRAACAVAVYVGGVRPEAMRAAAPEPEPERAPGEAAPEPASGEATIH
jgi:Kef-type K+ transport system membrane component KefB/nucleotide-binding universal stress UspA family protein